MNYLSKLIQSTNGTNQLILAVLFAAGAFFGIDEASILGLVTAATSLIMYVREIAKGERKGKLTINVYTYIATGLTGLFVWMGGIFDALKPLVEYLFTVINGSEINFGALLGLLWPIINQLIVIFKEKPWEKKE